MEPKEIRECFEQDDASWFQIREARAKDVAALGPDSTWDPKDRKARMDAGRPCLSFDELGQYVNQLVNDARETKRAIEVNPAGDQTSAEQARLVAAIIRQIEYESNAQLAYTRMFEDAATGSYGFLRIVPEYIQSKIVTPTARAFDQKLVIKPVHNPDIITPGYFTLPDFSDATRFWVQDSYEHEEFRQEFGDAKIRDFTGATFSEAGTTWLDDTRVWVRELWELKTKPKELLLLPPLPGTADPVAFWTDDIPEADRATAKKSALRVRTVDEPYVCQTITNGLEVLREKKDWPGRYLPIVGCTGKILWTREERQILSLIRNALGPQQLYNYYRTTEAEIVGMTPKVPWFAYKGALDPGNRAALAASNHTPVGVIDVDPKPEGWNSQQGPMPFPTRSMWDPPIQAFEVGAESTRRGIQSATGTGFLPTAAQRQNEKSGIALKEIASSAQKGAYHFLDNYEHALRRVGLVLVDLIPHYYDSMRTIHVRGLDDKTQQVRINDPQAPAPQDYGGKPVMIGPKEPIELDVTIGTGPSYAHERDKASEFADQLVAARPEVFSLIGGDVIRLKNLGPIGDQIAKILDAMAPPQVQAVRNGDQPMPPQAQQAMAQLQQAQQMIAQLQKVIETEQIKGQTQIQIKQLEGQIKLALAELQGEQKIQQLAATVAADIDTREDEQAHEMAMKGAEAARQAQQAEEAAYQADKARVFGGGSSATS